MGKKKKQEYAAYIKIGGRNICVDELVDMVNKCDKQYGIRLKHHDIWAEPEQFIQVIEARADMNIAALICCLNGVAVKDYFETDHETGYGTICKPIGIRHKCFTDESALHWNDYTTKYDPDSLVFRCRFASLVLSQLLGRLDTITYKESVKRYKFKHSRAEKRIMLTKDIMNYILRFVLVMISQEPSYKNIILKMHEYVSYTKKKVEYVELRNLLNGHILTVRRGMAESLLSERFMSDDLAIYNILKVAYMLATNKTNLDVIPNFKHIEGATVHHDLLKLIEELGYQVINNTRDKKYAPMFKAFIEARPSVWSQFYKESGENYAIQVGLLSLAYAKFVFNDRTIGKFIDNMLKKGK